VSRVSRVMRVQLEFDSCNDTQLRAILATCSRLREHWDVGDWRPRVTCDGPQHFGVVCDPVVASVARQVIERAAGVD
jgi:hypothetical protein